LEKPIQRKIAIVSYSDSEGGAATAARRLFEALRENSKNTKIDFLVYRKFISSSTRFSLITRISIYFIEKIESVIKRIIVKNNTQMSFLICRNFILHLEFLIRNYDVINFHWTGGVLFDYFKLNKTKIFWSLHDMNPFTGGCHYNEKCQEFKNKCENCILLKSNHRIFSKTHFKIKKRLSVKQINFISLSNWIGNELMESSIFNSDMHKVTNLPNTINTSHFKPLVNQRKIYDVMFICTDLSDYRKGGRYVLQLIKNNKHLKFLIIGSKSNKFLSKYPNLTLAGSIRSEDKLINFYRQSKATVLPSIQENLSNVILESLSCGTPVVGFDIGGNRDFIKHDFLGDLSKKIDIEGFEKSLKRVLDSNVNAMKIHNYICKNYSYNIISKKYDELFI
jgi:glycosyltransferase involved in cell wall biosynthesis